MKHLRPALAAAFLLASPARAGEAGLLLSKLLGPSQSAAGSGKYDEASPRAVGFRVGWSLLDLKVAELSLTGTYQPKAQADLVLNGTKLGRYGVESVAAGAQLDFKVLINFNAGVEMRQERLSWELTAGGQDSSTQTRPWLRAGLGFTLPTPYLSPFLRLEVAAPARKEDRTATPDQLRKALAPQAQVGLYAGIRF